MGRMLSPKYIWYILQFILLIKLWEVEKLSGIQLIGRRQFLSINKYDKVFFPWSSPSVYYQVDGAIV